MASETPLLRPSSFITNALHNLTEPTELSKFKSQLRRVGPRTFDALIGALGEVCDLFTPQDCWNYFNVAVYVAT